MKNEMLLCAAMVVGALACAHEPRKTEVPATAAPSTAQPQTVRTAQSSDPLPCSSDLDCDATQQCIGSRCVDITADTIECRTTPVHFNVNRTVSDR
jgi:hypothetical protein